MMKGTWILERCVNDRFPYRLQILRGDKPWLVLRTQDRWPAAGRHIFCLREDEPPLPREILEELERVNIVAFNERGRRISVVLDRLRALTQRLSQYRLGFKDVEPDILGRAYEYLLRKFAEGQGQSAWEFYTPREVAILMACILKRLRWPVYRLRPSVPCL